MDELGPIATFSVLGREYRIRARRVFYRELQDIFVPVAAEGQRSNEGIEKLENIPKHERSSEDQRELIRLTAVRDDCVDQLINLAERMIVVEPGQKAPDGMKLREVTDGRDMLMRWRANPALLMLALREITTILIVSTTSEGPRM